ncbi:hypothetical protein ACIBSV_11875 [Embleya sp. NPDC050154]|uniref:hypothetical protein n=1 Tax=Embleya sp. NPDC050154 TaxID=3363988 RepID=UPI003791F7BE
MGDLLADHTTLRLGGPADRLRIHTDPTAWPDLAAELPDHPWVLGGGSNVLAPDTGHRGTVVVMATRHAEPHLRRPRRVPARRPREPRAFREIGDEWGQLQAMGMLGRLAEVAGDYSEASRWHREGLRIAETLGLWIDASTRWSELGRIALLTQNYALAEQYHERGRLLALEQGDKPAQEFAEVGPALGARRQGRLDDAEKYLRTRLEWNHRFDADNGTALLPAELGFVAELRGHAETAMKLHSEGLEAAGRTGDPRAVALALEGLAGASALVGRHGHAARLPGAATETRASVRAPLPPGERGDIDRISAATRAALGDTHFAAAFTRGANQIRNEHDLYPIVDNPWDSSSGQS